TRIESQNEQREKKIAQLNDFIARFSAGTRSSQVNARKKEVERLATSELARSNIARPFIAFKMERPSGKNVLEFEKVNKSYTQKDGKVEHVINNFSAAVQRGDKVILMGRNGQGKTTLLKALSASGPGVEETDVSIDSGTVKWGHEVQIGYFAQDHKGSIQLGMTAADWLHQYDPKAAKEDIRGILGQMQFKGEEGLNKTDALSGGRAAGLLFFKIIVQTP